MKKFQIMAKHTSTIIQLSRLKEHSNMSIWSLSIFITKQKTWTKNKKTKTFYQRKRNIFVRMTNHNMAFTQPKDQWFEEKLTDVLESYLVPKKLNHKKLNILWSRFLHCQTKVYQHKTREPLKTFNLKQWKTKNIALLLTSTKKNQYLSAHKIYSKPNAALSLQMAINSNNIGGSSVTFDKSLKVFTEAAPEYSVEDYFNAVTAILILDLAQKLSRDHFIIIRFIDVQHYNKPHPKEQPKNWFSVLPRKIQSKWKHLKVHQINDSQNLNQLCQAHKINYAKLK